MLSIKPTALFMKLNRCNIDMDCYKSLALSHRALEETC
jgi:hypothetical protein